MGTILDAFVELDGTARGEYERSAFAFPISIAIWRGHGLRVPLGLVIRDGEDRLLRMLWMDEKLQARSKGITLVAAATLVASDLLLAEELARVDLSDRKAAGPWYAEHGVLDLAHFFPGDDFAVSHHVREDPGIHDAISDVLRQQSNMRWHLTALVRLSDERERADPPRPGWAPHEGWDPAWAQPALQDPEGGVLWLGASSNVAMRTEPDGVPILWVPASGWYNVWDDYDVESGPPSGRWSTGRLSADWWGLVELERRLLEPYVRRAAEYEVEVRRAGFERDLSRRGVSLEDYFPGPLVVHERRWWSSLLAPVYLQLLEGLRRVTEGQRGAGLCRECGQPFLTLDARRSSFCTDRERFRFSQRERRKRLSAPTRRT